MGEHFKKEAVKEHLTVLNNSRNLQQQNLDTNITEDVVHKVNEVLREHLRPTTLDGNKLVTNIAVEIIKKHRGNVKFSFIVIVTNQRVNGQLHKIPVFVIQHGNRKVFIDMYCFSYSTWDSFRKHAAIALPDCQFSFPADGHYREDMKLKVSFASTAIQVGPYGLPTFVKWPFVASAVAETCLFNTGPIAAISLPLMPLAREFLLKIEEQFSIYVGVLSVFIDFSKKDPINFMKRIPEIFWTLKYLCDKYQDTIYYMKDQVKNTFWKIWTYLRRKCFPGSESVPIRLLPIVTSTNIDYYESNSYAQKIFKNCRNDSVFDYNYGEKSDVLSQDYNHSEKSDVLSQDLAPITKSLLSTTANIVNKYPTMQFPRIGQQIITEKDFPEVFLSVKSLVEEKFEEKFAWYNKSVKAVTESSRKKFDINLLNKSLGIHGDPKEHFLMESMKSVNQLPTLHDLVYKKCLELKEQEPVLLIPCMKDPNDERLGLYRCIGALKGLVSTNSFVKGLSKIFDTDEDNFVEKEENNGKSAKITLLFDNYVANILQEANENNDVEGMMFIYESPIQKIN